MRRRNIAARIARRGSVFREKETGLRPDAVFAGSAFRP